MTPPVPSSSRPSEDPEPPGPPARVGSYVIGARIGRGGMGQVHEAIHEPSGRRVAIKLVKAGASARACARLLGEARAARAAASELVVEVLDAGLGEDGLPFVVMERLDGEDLGAALRREGRLPTEVAMRIATELLRGLERVHGAGVVHRDLKPENVFLVGPAGEAPPAADVALKIVDFGVSKVRSHGVLVPGSLTRDGVVLGTPLYMSPEQSQGLPDVDERSDLWSTGAILFQCLAGRAPHAGATYEQIVVAVCSTDAPDVRTCNPAVPAPIAAVLARALARDRRRRFQDARAMREALERAAAGEADAAEHDVGTLQAEEGAPGMPPSRPGVTAPFAPRRPRTRRRHAPGIAVAVASLVAGGLIALLGLHAAGLTSPPSGDAPQVAGGNPPGEPAPRERAAQVEPIEAEAAEPPAPEPSPIVRQGAITRADAPAAPPSVPRIAPPKRGIAAGLELRER